MPLRTTTNIEAAGSTFYLDYENGNDANDGSDWANAWKTITSGATAERIAPGDAVGFTKGPDPSSVGNVTWTDCLKCNFSFCKPLQ